MRVVHPVLPAGCGSPIRPWPTCPCRSDPPSASPPQSPSAHWSYHPGSHKHSRSPAHQVARTCARLDSGYATARRSCTLASGPFWYTSRFARASWNFSLSAKSGARYAQPSPCQLTSCCRRSVVPPAGELPVQPSGLADLPLGAGAARPAGTGDRCVAQALGVAPVASGRRCGECWRLAQWAEARARRCGLCEPRAGR